MRTEHWYNGTDRGNMGNRPKRHFVHQSSNLAVQSSYIVYNNSVNLLQNVYRLYFPEIKLTVRGVDYPHPSSVEVQERVKVRLCSPSGPSRHVIGLTLPFTLHFNNSFPALQSTVCCTSFQNFQFVHVVVFF